MRFEAMWCLTNVASGTHEQCEAIVAAEGFMELMAARPSATVPRSWANFRVSLPNSNEALCAC